MANINLTPDKPEEIKDSAFEDKFKNFKLPKLDPKFKPVTVLTKDEKLFIDKRILDAESQVKILIETVLIKDIKNTVLHKFERVWYDDHPLHFIMNSKEYKAKDEDDVAKITTDHIFSILDANNLDINDMNISMVTDVVTKYI